MISHRLCNIQDFTQLSSRYFWSTWVTVSGSTHHTLLRLLGKSSVEFEWWYLYQQELIQRSKSTKPCSSGLGCRISALPMISISDTTTDLVTMLSRFTKRAQRTRNSMGNSSVYGRQATHSILRSSKLVRCQIITINMVPNDHQRARQLLSMIL